MTTSTSRAITYNEPPGKFSPNGKNFLPAHPETISASTWNRVTIARIRSGQDRAYADTVVEAEILFEGGCRSAVAGCDFPYFSNPSEELVKQIARAHLGGWIDEPGPFDPKLAELRKIEHGHCHSIWFVRIVQPYCD